MILDDGIQSDHAEEDENYFISMTDMMVGVLFIFLIMLMVFALNFREQTDLSKEKIEKLKAVSQVANEVARKLEELRQEVHGELDILSQANQVRSNLLQQLRDSLKAEGLDVQIDEANGVLRLTEDAIRFPVNSSNLLDKALINVDKVAHALNAVLPRFTSCHPTVDGQKCFSLSDGAAVETVFIEGHTDVTGDDDRNWQLSTERAVNTYREMTEVVPLLRSLKNSDGKEVLSVSGYASTRPIDSEMKTDAYEKNRRIDLRFVMEVDSRQRLQEILAVTDKMKSELNRLQDAVEQAK